MANPSSRSAAAAAAESKAAEARFLKDYDPSAFDRPSVAVDVVLLAPADGALHTLLIQRREHPQKGRWALPGAFVRFEESLPAAAERALQDKAGLEGIFLEQLYTFGAPKRDPRARVLSVAHMALVDRESLERRGAAEGAVGLLRVPWAGEAGGPVEVLQANGKPMPLAFDHAEILGMAVKRLRGKLDYTPVGFQLLPERFTLLDLQRVHETVMGRKLNKDSFRRRMLASGHLRPTGEFQEDVGHRPAALYRFDPAAAV
jgi:8-oxo-dGTP diphosphatase